MSICANAHSAICRPTILKNSKIYVEIIKLPKKFIPSYMPMMHMNKKTIMKFTAFGAVPMVFVCPSNTSWKMAASEKLYFDMHRMQLCKNTVYHDQACTDLNRNIDKTTLAQKN